jgi:hypothetical protein
MKAIIRRVIQYPLDLVGLQLIRKPTTFAHPYYLRHNQRRQEHLASLNLDIAHKSVVEIGAGVGDHTEFWLDRKADILITEARAENLKILRARYPANKVQELDMDQLENVKLNRDFEIVYCYGLLYHLGKPAEAIEFMARHCSSMLLLESCVSVGDDESVNLVSEVKDPTQSFSGTGCRPTRVWVHNQLKKYFNHVYMPVTQPAHPEFPLDWKKKDHTPLTRAVFVASRTAVDNELLTSRIPDKQYLTLPEAVEAGSIRK